MASWAVGDQITAARLGIWTAYTPTLTGSSSNPTGYTASGEYIVQNDVVHGHFSITTGAGSGGGQYYVSCPVTPNTSIAYRAMGIGKVYDASTGNTALVMVRLDNTNARFQLVYATALPGPESTIGQTTPWTWAAGDGINGQFSYRI